MIWDEDNSSAEGCFSCKIMGFGVLVLLPQAVCKIPSAKCNLNNPLPILHKYYQSGDVIIGGIMSQIYTFSSSITFKQRPCIDFFDDHLVITQLYQHILAFVFAVKEINGNPKLLPNITLGFQIYNSLFTPSGTYDASLELISAQGRFVPNYKCAVQNNPIAVTGGSNLDICLHMSNILCIYKIPQLFYGSPPVTDTGTPVCFSYKMVPSADDQFKGILQLLLHFRWTWIGVAITNHDRREHFIRNVVPMFAQKGICLDFIARAPMVTYSEGINEMVQEGINTYHAIMRSTVNVVVVLGEIETMILLNMFPIVSDNTHMSMGTKGKVWILTAQMDFTSLSFQRNWGVDFLHGALSLAVRSKEVLGFRSFLQTRSPLLEKEDGFIKDFWQEAFNCSFPDPAIAVVGEETCTGEEKLETLPTSVFEMSMTGHSYSIYTAIYAVAQALHKMQTSKFKHKTIVEEGMLELQSQDPWKLHLFLKSISFNSTAGEQVSFNPNGELETGFDIINWITFPNQSCFRVRVGRIDPMAPQGEMFTIFEDAILWPSSFNQTRPRSLCNPRCHLGSRKAKKEGKPFCCYDCRPCSKGKISTQMDTDACFSCPPDHYPNEEQNLCIPKKINFLSYEEPLGVTLAILASSFSVLTAVVLGIFVKYKDTPIVKANNRSLTYLLLFSLMLSFSSALIFIGQPKRVTCVLRHIIFAIAFCLAVSCILTKTIIVVFAFKATKPGSKMRKWVGRRLSISVVLSCLLIEITLCSAWLASSPPFPDLDMHSMLNEIVLHCNAGLNTKVFYVFGFLIFLTITSFAVAFLARRLPDSFNETKFIIFSMLLICTVWGSSLPAYLSSKGKQTVSVEVFSILASSTGLLICIFSPKCYIIVLRPQLNNREQLARRRKK
ncbi:vomeronasal type-2 receptor 26-like [Pogona vitticeps]